MSFSLAKQILTFSFQTISVLFARHCANPYEIHADDAWGILVVVGRKKHRCILPCTDTGGFVESFPYLRLSLGQGELHNVSGRHEVGLLRISDPYRGHDGAALRIRRRGQWINSAVLLHHAVHCLSTPAPKKKTKDY